jgi:predicted Zn finger-like uncharacterized protein
LIIQCEKCTTIYHLDESLLEPFGSKVRCSRCGHIFRVNPSPLSEVPRPKEIKPVSDPLLPSEKEQQEEEIAELPSVPNRKTFWVLGTLVVLILIALTARFFYIQYLHPKWSSQDVLSALVFLEPDPEGNHKIRLINIKKFFR